MGFKEKLTKMSTDYFLKKNGDRITQVQGNVVSVKVEEKSILWIFHRLIVTFLVRPERSKTVIKCVYNRRKWFKKPEFMVLNQGNLVVVQGLKGIKSSKAKDSREAIEVMNVMNLTTKKSLIPMEGNMPKQIRKIKRH